ncbi:hypothetical protein ACQVRY_13865 [Ralstonia pseudosolanacearum]|nr:hypothetical protein [Ralstonia solanacearum]
MTKKDAYNFFLIALSRKVVQIQHALDSTPLGSPMMMKLTDQLTETQRLLAALDDIATAVPDA